MNILISQEIKQKPILGNTDSFAMRSWVKFDENGCEQYVWADEMVLLRSAFSVYENYFWDETLFNKFFINLFRVANSEDRVDDEILYQIILQNPLKLCGKDIRKTLNIIASSLTAASTTRMMVEQVLCIFKMRSPSGILARRNGKRDISVMPTKVVSQRFGAYQEA